MKKQDIVTSLAEAYEGKNWGQVAVLLRSLGISVGSPVVSGVLASDINTSVEKVNKSKDSPFVNSFVDDLTMEKQLMESDRKMNKNISPRTRRDPSNNNNIVVVKCRNCDQSMNVTNFEIGIKRGLESGFVCGSCMKNARRSR